jgi:hypothetical protein
MPKNPAGVILPAVICALACVFFHQSGTFFLFSLLPIGIAGVVFSPLSCWFSVSYSIILFAGSLVVFQIRESPNILGILLQTGAFSLLLILFAWIIAPPSRGPAFLRIRTAFRLVISSIILFSLHIPLVYSFLQDEAFYQSFLADVEAVLSITALASGGSDAVDQALIKDFLTPENIIGNVVFFGLRGGGLVSILFFFFVNRQFSLSIAKMIRKKSSAPELALFKIKPSFIWIFSLSILILLSSFFIKLEIFEIIAWNIFVICVMVYAAQGMGIVLFFLSKPNVPRGLRILLNFLFIIMIFRFSVMIFFLTAVTILGVLEHWLPLRVTRDGREP